MIIFSWLLFAVAILNLLFLSFSFREFSLLLTLQFFFSAVGLPIATYLITKHNLLRWFMTYDKENLTPIYIKEIDEEEFNLEGRFLINE